MAIRKFIRKRTDGTTYNRWGYDFRDENGIRHRLTNCKTKAEAERMYKITFEKKGKGKLLKENKTLTFKDLSENFLEHHAKIIPICKQKSINI